MLSPAGVVGAARRLAGRVGRFAFADAVVARLGAFVVWDRLGVLARVWLLAVAADAGEG